MELTRRQWLWTTLLLSASAFVSNLVRAEEPPSPAALEVLKGHLSVDTHSHGGTSGITSKAAPSDELAKAMRAGGLAAVCLATVPDAPLLGRDSRGVLRASRRAGPDELHKFNLNRLDWIDTLVADHGMRRALTVEDLRAAHAAGQPAIVYDMEGRGPNTVRQALAFDSQPLEGRSIS